MDELPKVQYIEKKKKTKCQNQVCYQVEEGRVANTGKTRTDRRFQDNGCH